MAQFVTEVVGVDASEHMIHHANKDTKSNCSFIVRSAIALAFKEKFDVITCFMCLHWIEQQKEALSAMYEALKPAGRLAIRITYDDYAFMDAILATVYDPQWAAYLTNAPMPFAWLQTESRMEKLLVESGFTDYVIDHSVGYTTMTDRQTCANWLKTFLPFTAFLPQEFIDPFYEAIMGRYIAQHELDPNGPIPIRRHWLEVIAYKNADSK